MRQKFSITVADVPMNIVCEESRETVDAAVAALNAQIGMLTSDKNRFCTRTEAALLAGLDYCTRVVHLEARIKELEEYLHQADPNGNTREATLLRGENEALRAELQLSRGENDALLQDNMTLFELNAKLHRQNGETNARADRMHDQVLSILTEVRELREKLASMCIPTREPSPAYTAHDPEPAIEISEKEMLVTRKYEHIDS